MAHNQHEPILGFDDNKVDAAMVWDFIMEINPKASQKVRELGK